MSAPGTVPKSPPERSWEASQERSLGKITALFQVTDKFGRLWTPLVAFGILRDLRESFGSLWKRLEDSWEVTPGRARIPTYSGTEPQIWEKYGAVPAKASKTLSSKARWPGNHWKAGG